jgi:LysM repeat protein
MRKSLYTQNQMSSKQIQENQGDSWKKKTSSSYKALFDLISLRPSIVLVVLFLSVTVFTFGGCGGETPKEDLDLINGRLEQLENKILQLEAQFTETKESVTTLGSYVKTLEERIDTFTKKIEKTPVPKQAISQEKKQYHNVVRGDTLYSISRKYGLSVEEIRRLNNLNKNQSIQPGQKLMVTTDSHK